MRIIGCDLRLDLKLYRVPDEDLEMLNREFPDFEIRIVNVEGYPSYYEDMEIYWGNRINPTIIEKSKSLKWIHFGSLGVNNARTETVEKRGILVTNSKGTVEKAVALSALAFLLSLTRGIQKGKEISLDRSFSRSSFDSYYNSLSDFSRFKTLIVGYGEIGRILAQFLKAIGSKIDVIVKNIHTPRESIFSNLYTLSELSYAVSSADAVINLLPLTNETRDVFNAEVFQKMKTGSFFINVGRGETVVESELIHALKTGKLAGAGLDVFYQEPLTMDSELHCLSNVLITPHIAAISPVYWEKEIQLFKKNLQLYRDGLNLENIVDIKKGY